MTNLNDIDTEGTDRVDMVTGLVFDEITDRLHHDHSLAGELEQSTMPASDTVLFKFADGRTITVRLEISDPVT